MIIIVWPLVIATTAILYILTVLSLPFNALYATIFLFSLIAFWTKLPGYCIGEPLPIIYSMDLVDIFVIIIAAHVNIFYSALFALFWNIFPRLCGGYKPWAGISKDGISMAILAFFVPLMKVASGENLLTVVLVFSIIRYPLLMSMNFIIPHMDWPTHIIRVTTAAVSVLFINVIYAKLFGSFFESLVKQGASFSWILFFAASAIILAFSIIFMGFSPKKATRDALRSIIRISRRHSKSRFNPERDLKEMDLIRESLR
jgi:hypothetical protein